MADFFRGLTGGFQTGLQLGQQIRNRRMEDELGQAYAKPETFTDYTPEQAAQIRGLQATGAYDVEAVPGAAGAAPTLRYTPRQGLDLQGDMPAAPVEIAPQQVQRYRDQTTAGQFDPTALRGLQMQEAANVLGRYGQVQQAEDLRARAEEQAYQAKVRPLQVQGLEQQTKLGGTQLAKAQREAAEQQKYDQFTQAYADAKKANPGFTVADASALADQFGLNPDQKYNFASRVTGISESEFKSSELAIKSLVKNKGLDELLKLHESSDLLDPGSHFVRIAGPKGAIAMQRVDTATGRPVGEPMPFRNEAEATGYLYTMATRPEAAVEYTAALEKQAQERRKLDLEEQKTRAQIGLASAQTSLAVQGKKGPLGQWIADYTQATGHAPTAEEIQLKSGLVGKPGKDVELPAAGTRVRRPDGTVAQADGEGGYIALKGVLPDDRPQVLAGLKVPPHVADVAQWSRDGTMLGFNNAAYPLTEAGMKALTKAVNTAGAQGVAADERMTEERASAEQMRAGRTAQAEQMRAGRTAQAARDAAVNQQTATGLYRPTMGGVAPNPRAPSPYAQQQEWLAYRESQRLRAQQN